MKMRATFFAIAIAVFCKGEGMEEKQKKLNVDRDKTEEAYLDYREYMRGGEFKQMDANSLVRFDDILRKDRYGVYYRVFASNMNADGWFILEGADAETFTLAAADPEREGGNNIFKDKNSVYIRYSGRIKKIEGSDSASFEAIDKYWYKDKNTIYCYSGGFYVVEGADAATFEIINGTFQRDKNAVFAYGKKLEGSDPATFVKVGGKYYKDKAQVYLVDYAGKAIGAEAASFQAVKDTPFFRDRKALYNPSYNGAKIVKGNYDAPSFEPFYIQVSDQPKKRIKEFATWDGAFYQDKSYIYNYKRDDNELTPVFDRKSFSVLGYVESPYAELAQFYFLIYVKDAKNVYTIDKTKLRRLEGADVKTFAALGEFGKDKNGVWRNGEIYEGLDAASFVQRGKNYWHDKDRLIISGEFVTFEGGFNPALFEPIDDTHFYYDGMHCRFRYVNGDQMVIEQETSKTKNDNK
jgi:hypothetical protein